MRLLIDYWRFTRNPLVGIFVVTPFWVLYEVLAFKVNHGFAGIYRTGTDYLLKHFFRAFGIPLIFTIIIPIGLITIALVYRTPKWRNDITLKPAFVAFLFLESTFYAVVVTIIITPLLHIALNTVSLAVNHLKVDTLVVHIGSGVFEEFYFRFLLLSLLVFVFQKGFHFKKIIAMIIAVLLSSVAFSLFHFVGVFKEVFHLEAFLFRFVAGILFAVLYIYRGFGVAVYTHSFYNIFLMFR